MATIYKEIIIDAPVEHVWDAMRDVGALHTRLVPGFVTNTRLEGDVRVVTFANGMVVTEPIVSLDDTRRRLVWTLKEGANTTHYNAVLEAHPDGDRTRVRWTTDLLPNEVTEQIGQMQDQALAAMKRALSR
jgi:carbon monoxide dehydrogenase subunit G